MDVGRSERGFPSGSEIGDMDSDYCEQMRDWAAEKAAEACTPEEMLPWLDVANAWADLGEHLEPVSQPEAPSGFMPLEPASDETVRVTLRIDKEGKTVVICDPRWAEPLWCPAGSPSEGAELAMRLLDIAQAQAK